MSCIFCKIINKEAPGQFVYEDETVVAIVPNDKVTKGHVLVIPKDHYRDIFDIDESVLRGIASITKQLSIKAVDGTGFTAVNILNESGADSQQSVFHFHIHIVPRMPSDGLDMWIKQKL
jgi:histidine triad (HIT) family protein